MGAGGLSEKIKVEIELPKKLYEEAMKKAEEAGFSNFSEFVVFVLEQLVSEEESGGEVFSEEDEEKVKERLRALGYIE